MPTLQQLLEQKPFSIIVSLPENKIEFAKAAVEAGVDAIKFHINVQHFASGNSFGPIEEYTDFVQQVRYFFDGPIGVVLGDSIETVSQTDYAKLKDLSIQYFSLYSHHVDQLALTQTKLEKTVAINAAFPLKQLQTLEQFPLTALELSIIAQQHYGEHIHLDDLVRYQAIRQQTKLPLIIPSQKKLTKQNIEWLQKIGMNAVMLGAVCIGKDVNSIYDNIVQLTH